MSGPPVAGLEPVRRIADCHDLKAAKVRCTIEGHGSEAVGEQVTHLQCTSDCPALCRT